MLELDTANRSRVSIRATQV